MSAGDKQIMYVEIVGGDQNTNNPPVISGGGGSSGIQNKLILGTQATLVSNGAAVIDTQFSVASTAYDNTTALNPFANFVLMVNYTVAPSGGSIDLYRQDLNIDGANDAPLPVSGYKHTYIGSFHHTGATGAVYLPITGAELIAESAYVIHNNGTGQTIPAGWTLKISPYGNGS